MSILEDKELKSDVKRILFYLENDDRTGKPGLIKEMELLKTDLNGLNNKMITFMAQYNMDKAVKKRDIKWLVVLWSTLSTGVILGVKALFTLIFK